MRVLRGVVYRMNSKGPRTEPWGTPQRESLSLHMRFRLLRTSYSPTPIHFSVEYMICIGLLSQSSVAVVCLQHSCRRSSMIDVIWQVLAVDGVTGLMKRGIWVRRLPGHIRSLIWGRTPSQNMQVANCSQIVVLCCHLPNTNEELGGIATAIPLFAKLRWSLFY